MRLVIPYKYTENSEELRYTIRSMVKHFIPLSGVLLVGDKPEWFCGDHIPLADIMYPDQPARIWKERSIQLKILAVPDEVFLYANDDFFALQDFKTVPYYYDMECREILRTYAVASYKDMYEQCSPHWKNFDVHAPMIMMRDKFHQAYQEMIEADSQWPIKTTYAHTFVGTRYADMKIRGAHTTDELNFLTKDRPFFSTHNSTINDDLINFLDNLYPNKSIYES